MSAKLFLTDYASYNEGNQFQFGHWVDLTKFSDAEEFQEYIKNHFLECDKKSPLFGGCKREETMFTDFEGFPDSLYGEAMSFSDLEKIFKYIEFSENYDIDTPEDILKLVQEHQSETGEGTDIWENDEDFIEDNFSTKAQAVNAAIFGEYNYGHDYAMIDQAGNIQTFEKYNIEKYVELDKAIEWKLKNM
jgi:hypothetical protein